MIRPAPLPFLLLATALAGAEVTLVSGSVVEGDIISESATEVRLRVSHDGLSAERSWPRAEIAGISNEPSRRQQAVATLRTEATSLPGDAPAATWLRLGRQARSLKEPSLARSWLLRAVARDRSQADAQRLLGREEVNGVWMRPAEAAAARGLVQHDGNWVSWGERERLVAEAAERRIHQQEALAERRRASAEQATQIRDLELPQRWSYTPDRVVWWGRLPHTYWPTAGCRGPLLRLDTRGRWGGVNWNMQLDW